MHCRALLLVPLLATAPPVHAEGPWVALNLQRITQRLDFASSTADTRINRISLALADAAPAIFHPALRLGYEYLTQTDNPATAGMSLTGNFLGIGIRSEFLSGRHANAVLNLDYSYHYVSDDNGVQKIKMTWNEGTAALGLEFPLSALRLGLGGYTRWMSGEETASGPITHTRDFDAAEKTGAYASLDYQMDQSGRIGLRFEQAARRSVGLSFFRAYY